MNADIRVLDHGSVVLVEMLTEAATAWVADHVGGETTFWGDALVVEPRYLGALLDGMAGDGLVLALRDAPLQVHGGER